MKQKHSTVTEDVSEWSEVEREYAQLLLVLHRGCLLNQIPYTWGCKRKRSAIQDSSFPSSSSSQTHHASASKANTSSPITPLSFPVTESDDSPSKISLKRKREYYYLQIIQDMTKTKAELNQEIENAKRHRDQLKIFNLKLKTRELELTSNGLKSECKIPNLEIDEALQLDQFLSNGSQSSSKLTAEDEEQKQQPMQMRKNHQNQNFGTSQICMGSQIEAADCRESNPICKYVSGHQTTSLSLVSASSAALGRKKGTLQLPDLNLPIEELFHVDSCQPLDETATNKDLSRAMAAQARQRRLQIFRLKKPIGA